jgi:hypothetical protein
MGRSVAVTNRHAAPTRFHSFSSPPIFSVQAKAVENHSYLERMWNYEAQLTGSTSFRVFVEDIYPYLRSIQPALTESHNLQSYVCSLDQKPHASSETTTILKEEQEAILALDDIVDFSD